MGCELFAPVSSFLLCLFYVANNANSIMRMERLPAPCSTTAAASAVPINCSSALFASGEIVIFLAWGPETLLVPGFVPLRTGSALLCSPRGPKNGHYVRRWGLRRTNAPPARPGKKSFCPAEGGEILPLSLSHRTSGCSSNVWELCCGTKMASKLLARQVLFQKFAAATLAQFSGSVVCGVAG